MKIKWIVSIIAIVTMIMMSLGIVSAETPNPVKQNQVQIPDSIKTLDELVKYLKSRGIIKTDNDILNYMKNNKSVILKVSPNLIDYGFTFRLYVETNTPTRDDGLTKITHDYGIKEAKIWVVPVVISNNSNQTIEISKENFALVPKNIPVGSELNVLAIEPEYIMDASNGNTLGKFDFPSKREVHLNAVFYVYPTTAEKNVNLRICDGKDHTDVNIAK
ncbi:hypothetical protein ACQCN2_01115 [Brevibacillus ginsengisoli]|uniref:hypothetical protein n=1 Tax=Brevibacillus ginsengisoli TaxID=363854 RepID=UPI003CEC91E4